MHNSLRSSQTYISNLKFHLHVSCIHPQPIDHYTQSTMMSAQAPTPSTRIYIHILQRESMRLGVPSPLMLSPHAILAFSRPQGGRQVVRVTPMLQLIQRHSLTPQLGYRRPPRKKALSI